MKASLQLAIIGSGKIARTHADAIGSENPHALRIVEIANVAEKASMPVTHLWGEIP